VWSGGLSGRTRRPLRYANQLPEQIEAAIVAAKRDKQREARKIASACCGVHAHLDRRLLTHPTRSRTRTTVRLFHKDRARTSCGAPTTGRIHARRQALLLSVDGHRSRFAVSVAGEAMQPKAESLCSRHLSDCSRNVACRRSDRTMECRSPPRMGVQSFQAFGVLVAAGHERIKPVATSVCISPEERSDATSGRQYPSAAEQARRLHLGVL